MALVVFVFWGCFHGCTFSVDVFGGCDALVALSW